MNKRPIPVSLVNSTEPIDVTFGVFDLPHGFRVPYMASLLRFQQIAEYLDLVTADPKYATQNWRVDELFQREVSQHRVYDLVDHYLKSESRPQFFNSLTIVLKPRNDFVSYQPPKQDPEYERALPVGPIMISYDIEDTTLRCPCPLSHGRLTWNRGQVYAVAIDGQHRLAAIKNLEGAATLTSSVSVLFLVLDEKLGFHAPTGWPARRAMRSIFVDLNKRAEKVSRARNLLLDDTDPGAQFVRRLFGPTLAFTVVSEPEPLGFPVGKDREFDIRIPLVLVDWHGETKSKIEQGPYVSSVLALDWIVSKTLAARHPKRPPVPDLLSMSIDDDKYYPQIENALRHWSSSWNNDGIGQHLQECQSNDRPFFLTSEEMDALATEYELIWGRPITRLLTTLGPYRDLVRMRLAADTLNPQFGQWYQARSNQEAHKSSSIKIRNHYRERLREIESALESSVDLPAYRAVVDEIDKMKRHSVFFYLVGQRALVFSLIGLVGAKNAIELAEACDLDVQKYENNIQDFYTFYMERAISSVWNENKTLFEKGYRVERDPNGRTEELSNSFWAGSLARRDQPQQIDFSERAAERGSRWFTLIAHMYWFAKATPLPAVQYKEVILEAVEKRGKLDGFLLGIEVMEAIDNVIGTASGSGYYTSPMSFLCGMLDVPSEDRTEMARTAAKERIGALAVAIAS